LTIKPATPSVESLDRVHIDHCLTDGCASILSFRPYWEVATLLEFGLIALFAVDLVLNFFVAFLDVGQQALIIDGALIRATYLR
jgi:hypothetical protein